MRRFHLTVLVLTLGVFLTAVPVSAVSVSGDFSASTVSISDATFVSFFGAAALLSVSDSPWSFGGNPAGTITSATYADGTGFFAYVYQIINNGATRITGMTIDPVFEIDDGLNLDGGGGGDPVFIISTDFGGDGLPAPLLTVFDDGFGTRDIDTAGIVPTPSLFGDTFSVDFLGAAGLASGITSTLFGFISIIPPAFTVANLIDGGAETTFATIVTTSPEPATVLLLGSGLLGLLGIRRRRRAA